MESNHVRFHRSRLLIDFNKNSLERWWNRGESEEHQHNFHSHSHFSPWSNLLGRKYHKRRKWEAERLARFLEPLHDSKFATESNETQKKFRSWKMFRSKFHSRARFFPFHNEFILNDFTHFHLLTNHVDTRRYRSETAISSCDGSINNSAPVHDGQQWCFMPLDVLRIRTVSWLPSWHFGDN